MIAVGVLSYHHMNDRPGTSHPQRAEEVLDATQRCLSPTTGSSSRSRAARAPASPPRRRLLEAWLIGQGYTVVLTHEPGDSDVGQKLRQILLDPLTGALDHRAEALLYAADKAEHVDKVVKPALARGAVVVTDRYVDSTLAYQGAGRDLPADEVEQIARWATADLRPHLTVLLDVDPELGARPVRPTARATGPARGRAGAFHQRVRRSFLALAAADPDHYLVVDAQPRPGRHRPGRPRSGASPVSRCAERHVGAQP